MHFVHTEGNRGAPGKTLKAELGWRKEVIPRRIGVAAQSDEIRAHKEIGEGVKSLECEPSGGRRAGHIA